jgi:hypothetical protein
MSHHHVRDNNGHVPELGSRAWGNPSVKVLFVGVSYKRLTNKLNIYEKIKRNLRHLNYIIKADYKNKFKVNI